MRYCHCAFGCPEYRVQESFTLTILEFFERQKLSKFIEIKNTDLDIYKANFGRVEIKIHCIDWLYLKHTGHRRAKFEYKNNKCNMSWLAP